MQLKNVKRKTICALLSVLHVCVLCIGIFIFTAPDTAEEVVLAVDTEVESTAETECVPESSVEIYETESASSEESITEPEETTVISYTFQYSGGRHNLNIRKGTPSMTQSSAKFRLMKAEGCWSLPMVNGHWLSTKG